MVPTQLIPADLPPGFKYQPGFLQPSEESELLQTFESLDFRPFEYQGFLAKRQVVVYGWKYDYGTYRTSVAPPIPEFLFAIRERAAEFAEVPVESLVQSVVNQYPPGAPIGWHRDVPQFEKVIGISLGSSCRMRLKPYKAEGKIVSVVLQPRSIYQISGDSRWKYQHSIPAVQALRYSITFRTLREKARQKPAA